MASRVGTRGPRSWPAYAWLALPFAILVGVAVFGVLSPYTLHQKPGAPGQVGALVWGDGLFSTPAQVRAWLEEHGASYEAWAKAHPAAVGMVRPSAVKRAAAVQKAAAREAAAARAKSVTATIASAPAPAPSSQTSGLIWIVVAVGIGLGALAATPRRFAHRVGVVSLERELRLAALGAGAALLLGVVIATVL